jgi:hypothetical protein
MTFNHLHANLPMQKKKPCLYIWEFSNNKHLALEILMFVEVCFGRTSPGRGCKRN